MAIYQMNRPVNSAVITMRFTSYNAAVDFAKQSGMVHASKPYKRNVFKDGEPMQIWCVTIPNMNPAKGTFTKIEETKPAQAIPAPIKKATRKKAQAPELIAA